MEYALRELADAAYQRKLWLASSGPEVSSFSECLSRLLEDSGLGKELEGPRVVYDRVMDEWLRDLVRVLDRIDDLRAPEVILDDPELGRVRTLASALLDDLRSFGSNEVS